MSISAKLFTCLFVQNDRRWRQLSFCFGRHKLHSGPTVEGYFV